MEIRSRKDRTLDEKEAQKIIKLLSAAVNDLYMKGIIHRDININNILIHFPSVKPTEQELQEPDIAKTITKKSEMLVLGNLSEAKFH